MALLAVWLLATGRFDRAAGALSHRDRWRPRSSTFLHVWPVRVERTSRATGTRHAHAVAYVAPLALLALALVAVAGRAAAGARVDAFLARHERTIGTALAIVAAGGVGLIVVVGRRARLERRHLADVVRDVAGRSRWRSAGIALATGPAFRATAARCCFLPVAVLLGTLAIYGVDARVQTDHFWAVRRLVSSALPLLAVFAGVAVAAAWARPPAARGGRGRRWP